MKHFGALMIGYLAIAAATGIGQTGNAPEQPKSGKTTQNATTGYSDRGQQVFRANCYRCHQEPHGFSSSVSGAIAKHMRVRAGLSNEDYKALLKFLNP